MANYHTIMVCLDDFQRDRILLDYVAEPVDIFDTKFVHLLYAHQPSWQTMLVPAYATDFLPPMEAFFDAPREGEVEKQAALAQLEELGQQFFGGFSDCRIICNDVDKSPLAEIVSYATEYQADMVVVGRHFGSAGEKGDHALFARRLTRRAACSVLTLPPNVTPRVRNILVPCRDTVCSFRALSTAVEIAQSTQGIIEALNIDGIPTGYAVTLSDYYIHLSLVEEAAWEECRRLIQNIDRGVEVLTRCACDSGVDPVDAILFGQQQFEADLIVIGARGRTGTAGMLLGTVTEQLIRKSTVPVLEVKQKGECIGVVQALREIWGGLETAGVDLVQ